MNEEITLTYQTRPDINERQHQILSAYGQLFNTVEHSLYAEIRKGKSSTSCKNAFLKQFGITARQFNACRVSLEGKIKAAQESQKQAAAQLNQKIKTLDEQIKRLKNKPSKRFAVHQKQRRKIHLAHRLERLKQTGLCFGGKKLFRAQFHLEQNGFASHEEWHKAWEAKRNSEFFILGSKDETSGNQTCVATVQPNGRLHLRLRLPKAMEEEYGKYIEIQNVIFAYGQETILSSLQNKQALCYRFKQDKKGWRVFVSTALSKPLTHSKEGNGVIGIDLNSDHIACIETDRFGNPISTQIYPWVSYGKTKNSLKATTAEVCKKIVDQGQKKQKPLVIEKLDFQKKRDALKETKNKKYARCLSSFAYGQFFTSLTRRAFKQGVAIHSVNPAYTSVIGNTNYAKRYGLSTHLAAALCIARRYQQFSESPNTSHGIFSDEKGGHVAFELPVRNRTKHVWHFWNKVRKKQLAALAAHFRAKLNRSSSPPSPHFSPTLEPIWSDFC